MKRVERPFRHYSLRKKKGWSGGGGYSLSELMSFPAPKKESGLARWGRGSK